VVRARDSQKSAVLLLLHARIATSLVVLSSLLLSLLRVLVFIGNNPYKLSYEHTNTRAKVRASLTDPYNQLE
jgi:hypothetical protein